MIGYNKNYKLQFGKYIKTHEYHNNITGNARMIGSLALRPTVNDQGGYYFYSLRTDRKINCNRCTPLTMPDDVISRIHALAKNDPMGITFTGRNEKEIKEYDDENDYLPSEEEYIKDDGSYHPGDVSTRDSGDDYPSDDDGPDSHFGPTSNGDGKFTGSHDTTEEKGPTDNKGAEKKFQPKTTQEWKSEMKPKISAKMRMMTPRTRLETVNQ